MSLPPLEPTFHLCAGQRTCSSSGAHARRYGANIFVTLYNYLTPFRKSSCPFLTENTVAYKPHEDDSKRAGRGYAEFLGPLGLLSAQTCPRAGSNDAAEIII